MRVERVLGVLAPWRVASLAGLLVALALLAAVSSGSAAAATPGPGLTIHSLAVPTHFSAGDNATECLDDGVGGSCDGYQLTVTNGGSQPAAGPIVVKDLLPVGLTVKRVVFQVLSPVHGAVDESSQCEPAAVPVTCTFANALEPDQLLKIDRKSTRL